MTAAPATAQPSLKPPFLNYRFGRGYDEMFERQGVPREHYQALYRTLLESPPEELRKSQQAADLSFLHQGITFTVYGNKEGTERIFPNDLLPRIIPGREWRKVEAGLSQRITALIYSSKISTMTAEYLPRGWSRALLSTVAATSAVRCAASASRAMFM